jgi:hypothetical protein
LLQMNSAILSLGEAHLISRLILNLISLLIHRKKRSIFYIFLMNTDGLTVEMKEAFFVD